jgi:hypothetical protein
MSVTFHIEGNPTGAFEITCYDTEQGTDVVVATADSYEAILVERAAHMLVCEDCRAYGCYSTPVMDVTDDLDVNVSNTNARMLLAALGIDADEELCGMRDGADFLGAVLLAMAADRDDTGVAPAEIGAPGHARMVDCGLAPGYYAEKFAALHALASEAARLGRTVAWS